MSVQYRPKGAPNSRVSAVIDQDVKRAAQNAARARGFSLSRFIEDAVRDAVVAQGGGGRAAA